MYGITNAGGGSGTKSTLIISIDSGSTVQVYSNSTYTTLIKTATEKTAGQFWVKGLDNGTYYIKATKGTDVATQSYTISEYGVYRISMGYTVTVTLNSLLSNAENITVKQGSASGATVGVYSVSSDSPSAVTLGSQATYYLSSDSTCWEGTITTGTSDQAVNCWFGAALFWYGYTNTALIGGWTNSGLSTTLTDNTYLRCYASQYNGYARTNLAIDVTSYSLLGVYGKEEQATTDKIGVTASAGTSFNAYTTIPTSMGSATADLSNVSGNTYVTMQVSAYAIQVYALWLE